MTVSISWFLHMYALVHMWWHIEDMFATYLCVSVAVEYLSRCHDEVLERLRHSQSQSRGQTSSSGNRHSPHDSSSPLSPSSDDRIHPVDTFLHIYALVHMWWHIEDTFAMRQLLQIPYIDPYGGESGATSDMIRYSTLCLFS